MDTPRAASTTAGLPVPDAPVGGLRPVWPQSVQVALGVLLGVAITLLASKWWMQSLEAGPSIVPSQRIDLNTATHAELRLLPGIGEQLAERIARVRADKGPFKKVDDLRQVPGAGPATLERLRSWVYVSANLPAVTKEPSLPLAVEPTRPLGAKARKALNLAGPIDINAASAADLMQIPGIGPKLSQRIVDERSHKPFQTVAELRRVSGIGPKILEKMRPFVTVGPLEVVRYNSQR